ncbi:MAG: putative zinc-binding protein [Candidatus Thorarchaeota archaeon]|nr:putative zinc-binding protein [Candidatus Thorarchaeota archaeon]
MTFKPKVGIIACSGEDCPGGVVSRQAALQVLHKLRPNETVTICLPLFLAGNEDEREFARVFPTITIDGCSKMCAAIATAKYSSEPAVKLNVEDHMKDPCSSRSDADATNQTEEIVTRIAEETASAVDRLRQGKR